ncbi:hypothetical protein GQ602_006255 [Ophiocordyceps camponoti-floridani]|uniref:Uncharacterized protein n=1 Tax=Ophiocordyceps camponoti-floridani TaxID=2030778 RepID=A0A8H4Q2U2_9HYPO|nr:hypothetical protein GQ602_006255 [Ophiocordyceps camponoti-floridani]
MTLLGVASLWRSRGQQLQGSIKHSISARLHLDFRLHPFPWYHHGAIEELRLYIHSSFPSRPCPGWMP